MSKKNLAWFFPSFDQREKQSLSRLVDSNFLNEGKLTRKFEKLISNFLNIKYAVAVTSGTSALTLSLLANGIGKGDEVIIPNFTFIASANAVMLSGAKPVFVDINSENFTIDVDKVKLALNEKVKAIISVDVNGRGCDYDRLEKICKKNNLKLICDSAEALGSKFKKKYLGTYGHCGCFSFSAAKTISTGQGGMIVTNNQKIFSRLLELKDQGRPKRGTGGNDFHPSLGFNFKYTDIQACVGIEQFKRLKNRIKKFNLRDNFYNEYLKNIDEVKIPSKRDEEVLQWYDILIKSKKKKVVKTFGKKKYRFQRILVSS